MAFYFKVREEICHGYFWHFNKKFLETFAALYEYVHRASDSLLGVPPLPFCLSRVPKDIRSFTNVFYFLGYAENNLANSEAYGLSDIWQNTGFSPLLHQLHMESLINVRKICGTNEPGEGRRPDQDQEPKITRLIEG